METFLGIDYPTLWFLVVGALFSGYAILDGFDLGAGAWHLFFRDDRSRRIALNAVGPVWDGNEVWLVIGGGALFAGFPEAYSTLFPAMYIPFILFLGCKVQHLQRHARIPAGGRTGQRADRHHHG